MHNIEDTITENVLPVNTYAMVNRLRDILNEGGGNSYDSLNEKDALKFRKCLWLINQQIFGQLAIIDMDDEWNDLCNQEIKRL